MENSPATRGSRALARLRRAPLLIAVAAVVPVILAACGSPASSSSAPPSAQANSSAGTGQAGMAKFAQCMREHGVTNMPDPKNGHFVMSGGIQSNPHFHSAIQACQQLLGPSGIGSGNSANASAFLAFAHCMQSHGVPDFPDPPANGALNVSGVDRSTPAYKSAFDRCQSKLPGAGQQG